MVAGWLIGMEINDSTAPVLVLGGTGTTGRRVARRLEERGVAVRIASRTGTLPFDWQDEATWPAMVEGVRAAYLCFSPDLAVPGAAQTVGRFAQHAVAAGVERLVLLSGRGEPGARAGERAVIEAAQAGGAEWTVVRSAWFAQNFSESFLADAVRAGTVALPVGEVGEPFVDVDDVADVAVAALLDPGHAREVYEVSGPRLLTFAQALAEIAAVTGHSVRFETITAAQHAEQLAADGADAEVRWLMDHLFTQVLDGRNAHLADGVQRALGRPARDFTDHLAGAAASGAWQMASVR